MKGVVKHARGHGFVDYRDVEESPLAPDQVKVEVKATGICGSDIHIYHDTINYPIRTPVVMGHEFSGVVVDIGSDFEDEIELGDRVTCEPSINICGVCPYCRSEYYNLCPQRRVLGYWFHGSFAPYCSARFVHRLPDSVSFEAGALTELLACCVHAVIEQAGVSAGDFVVVVGPGPVGLLASLVALAEGGTVAICGTESDRARLSCAQDLGVQHAFVVGEGDPAEEINRLSGGYGADLVVECAGNAAAVQLGLDIVRKRGKYVQMGLPGKPIEVNFEQIAYKELHVTGGLAQRRPSWKRALRLMGDGKIPAERLISDEFSLAEWEHAFSVAENREGVKVLLRPN